MDQEKETRKEASRTGYGVWLALAAAAAGVTAATVVFARKRASTPTAEIGRIISRCEAAARKLGGRIAQA